MSHFVIQQCIDDQAGNGTRTITILNPYLPLNALLSTSPLPAMWCLSLLSSTSKESP